jgi:hypothetical protein
MEIKPVIAPIAIAIQRLRGSDTSARSISDSNTHF